MEINRYKGKIDLSTLPPEINTKPVIFWDTCALLDIIRLLERYEAGKHAYDNYCFFLEKIENGEIVSMVSEMVLTEFNQHYDKEYEESVKAQNRRKMLMEETCKIQNDTPSTLVKDNMAAINIMPKLKELVEKIWENTWVIKDNEADFKDFAHYRLKLKLAPAHRKNEYKDCLIWGTCSIIAGRLPHSNTIFYTTNKADYTEDKENRILASLLQSDCTTNGVKFALSVGVVRRHLINMGF